MSKKLREQFKKETGKHHKNPNQNHIRRSYTIWLESKLKESEEQNKELRKEIRELIDNSPDRF